MSQESGTERRAEISSRAVDACILINGAAIAGLLTFLQAVWKEDRVLVGMIVVAVPWFVGGVFFGALSHFLRVETSLAFTRRKRLGLTPQTWEIVSYSAQTLALICFIGGSLTAVRGTRAAMHARDREQMEKEISLLRQGGRVWTNGKTRTSFPEAEWHCQFACHGSVSREKSPVSRPSATRQRSASGWQLGLSALSIVD